MASRHYPSAEMGRRDSAMASRGHPSAGLGPSLTPKCLIQPSYLDLRNDLQGLSTPFSSIFNSPLNELILSFSFFTSSINSL